MIEKIFNPIINFIKPKNLPKSLSQYILILTGCIAIAVSVIIYILALTLLKPYVINKVIPNIVNKIPAGEEITISKLGLSTKNNVPFTVDLNDIFPNKKSTKLINLNNSKIFVDPTVSEVSINNIQELKYPVYMTKDFIYTNNENGKIEVLKISQMKLDDKPLILSKDKEIEIQNTVRGVFFLPLLMMSFFSAIMIFIIILIIFIFNSLLATIITLTVRKIQKKNETFSEIFKINLSSSGWGLLIKIIFIALSISFNYIIVIVMIIRTLLYLDKKNEQAIENLTTTI